MANKNIIKQLIFSIKNKIFLNKHPVKQTKNQFSVGPLNRKLTVFHGSVQHTILKDLLFPRI